MPPTAVPSPRTTIIPGTTVEAVRSVIIRPPPASPPSVAYVPYLVDVRDLVRIGKSVRHCRRCAGRGCNAVKSGDCNKRELKFHGIILLHSKMKNGGNCKKFQLNER